MTYEQQLKKWAAKRYKIDINAIGSVDLRETKIYGGYCNTCSYEAMGIEVVVWNKKQTKTIIKRDKFEISMPSILKSIMDA